jgi:Uma2 family endonuclease
MGPIAAAVPAKVRSSETRDSPSLRVAWTSQSRRHARVYHRPMDGKAAMSSSASVRKLTYDDLQHFPDDLLRREIIDGELYVSAAPNVRHQEILGRLYLAFGVYLEAHPELGRVFFAPFDVVFSIHDVVEPDLVFVAADQLDILDDENAKGAPALLVEVLSPSTRRTDERPKRQLFERAGVREYWIVDPELDLIKVFRRADMGTLPRVAELTAEDHARLSTPLVPGLEIALDHLFR